MKQRTLQQLNEYRRKRVAAVLITDIAAGTQTLVAESDAAEGELGAAARRAFRTGKSTMVSVDGTGHFVNVHLPPARIVVIGAVHISQVMAPIARLSGFDMEIIDPRTAFASPERFPGVALFPEWPEEVLERRPLDRYCALAAITHDPKIDDFPLIAAIRAGCFFVGALGSRKTHAKRGERLAAAGLDAAEIAGIAAPIGLDIGASSPAEIAVAVMAQIIDAFRKRGVAGAQAAEEERMLDA